ncbi:hypothetical protein D3C81_1939220 [compost metagenome]
MPTGLLIEFTFDLIALAAIDWGYVPCDLLVALAGVGSAQFVKAFESAVMKDFSCREYSLPQERSIGFI